MSFREVIGAYGDELRRVSKVILGLLAEGLGLEAGFFDTELGQRMLVNHYPACPDPSLTLGVGGHCDPNLITIIQQEVYGLQILKDDKWIGVQPIQNAFVVNSGLPITVGVTLSLNFHGLQQAAVRFSYCSVFFFV